MDSFNAIPIFIAVAENQGFSSAATKLGLSKSAVSKRISQLEQQLGARLLHRSTRKISLTEAGERFYRHALQSKIAAQEAEDAVAELQGEPCGQLKIQVPMSFGMLHIAPLVAPFLAQYPQLRLDLIMDDKPKNLIEHGIDLAIRTGTLNDSNLIARFLAPLNSIICAAPSYLIQHQQPLHPAQLSEHNCINYSYSDNANSWLFKSQASSQLITVKTAGNYQVNNSEALTQALLQGLGIARLPTFIAGPLIQNGELVALLDDYEMPSKDLQLVYPERDYLPKKTRVFIDFLSQQFDSENPSWDNF